MRRAHQSRNRGIAKSREAQRGYMLISLMLMFALMAIALLAVLPDMVQQIKRDREEEMCRRGTQYMRAVQRFYRKLGRYPSRVEDLESTNNMRFLRKRYKDPLMKDAQGHDKDFKFLHIQDVMLNNGPMMGGAAGLSGLSGMMGQAGALSQAGGLQGMAGAQGLGGLQGMAGAQGLAALQGGLAQAGQFGGIQGGQSTTLNLNSSSDSSGSQGSSDSSGSSNGGSTSTGPGGSISASGSGLSGQTFGGGPILGVASTSKEKTIREFNKKNHYNDWYFIYDQSLDRGGLLVGPWQPLTMSTSGGIGQPIQGQPGTGQQGISQPGFGGIGQPQNGFGQTPQSPPAQQNPNGNSPQN
jgi:hypothetical protein